MPEVTLSIAQVLYTTLTSNLNRPKERFMSNRRSLLSAVSIALVSLLVAAHASAQCTWTATSSVLSTTSTCSVGVGTTTPGFPFEVVKDGGNGQLAASAFAAAGGAINFLGRGARGSFASPTASQNGDFFMVMGGRGYTGSGFATANSSRIAFRAAENFTPSAQGGFITFDTINTGTTALTERMRVTPDGVLLIGTTTPIAPPAGFNNVKLSVNGDIVLAGNANVKYQDVAEWVPATEKMSPGTVVVLDRSKSNHVMSSIHAYDTAVAGVVTDKPGLLLGEGGTSQEKIATTGRVKVRVDASKPRTNSRVWSGVIGCPHPRRLFSPWSTRSAAPSALFT